MVVTAITVKPRNGLIELSGVLVAERQRGRSRRIWWQLPGEIADILPTTVGDPFIPALLPLCMVSGERLSIEAAVSPTLSEAVHKIQGIYRRWLPHAQTIEVKAAAERKGKAGWAKGCFFSGGVDSFYSLLTNEELPAGDPNRLTHLIFVQGFDLPLIDTALLREVRARLRETADASGLQLLEVRTNLRAYSDRLLTWELYHGAALASVGLACGSLFDRVIIPATFSGGQLHPWGSHPELDPLWSTGQTSFIHDGSEITRIEKIMSMGGSQLALRNFRVCWKNYRRRYNCGMCEKCLRTMIALHIATGETVFPSFPTPLRIEDVRRLKLETESKLIFAREMQDLIPLDNDFDRLLAAALREAIARGEDRLKRPRASGRRWSV